MKSLSITWTVRHDTTRRVYHKNGDVKTTGDTWETKHSQVVDIPDGGELLLYYGDHPLEDANANSNMMRVVCITSNSCEESFFWDTSSFLCHFVNEGGNVRKISFMGYKKIPESDSALYAGDFGGFLLIIKFHN